MIAARAITRGLATFESVRISPPVIASVKYSSLGSGLAIVSDKTAVRCLSCERTLNSTGLALPIGCNLSKYYRPFQGPNEDLS